MVGKKTNGEDKHPTQEEIAKKLEKDRDWIKQYVAIATNLSPSVYELCKSHQINRGDQEPQFQFTEGWFRNSGLYGLSEKRQKQFFEWYSRSNHSISHYI